MDNVSVADALEEIADLLAMKGGNPFRERAYRNAGRVVRGLTAPLQKLLADDKFQLSDLPGIGKDLESKIRTLASTGGLPLLDQLRRLVPPSLRTLLTVPGIGPKRAMQLFTELKVGSLQDLRQAAAAHRIASLPGFGQRLEASILHGLKFSETGGGRLLLHAAKRLAEALVAHLKRAKGLDRITVAGSYRRHRESVGDLDILASCQDTDVLMGQLATFEGVARVQARGPSRMTVRLSNNFQVDLRVVSEAAWGAAELYFTGSKSHNIQLRQLALNQGLKLNEYGLFSRSGPLAAKTEEEVYRALKLDYIPPELREGKDELALAATGKIPKLVSLEDVLGDLHAHTAAGDGQATLESLVDAAIERGYRFIAITDHSRRATVARGLTPQQVEKLWHEIDVLQAKKSPIKILKGIEVDILEGGKLDLPDDLLRQADWVVGAIHYGQRQSRQALTERMINAIKHPSVSALAHPTGRLLGERPPMDADYSQVFAAAADFGCALEINGQPSRLDLNEAFLDLAKTHKTQFSLCSDAHSIADLDFIEFAVWQARRAGLDKSQILNTRDWLVISEMVKHAA